MPTLVENVNAIVTANKNIKAALAAQRVDVSDYTRLSQAPAKIAAIKGLEAAAPNTLSAGYEYIEV